MSFLTGANVIQDKKSETLKVEKLDDQMGRTIHQMDGESELLMDECID